MDIDQRKAVVTRRLEAAKAELEDAEYDLGLGDSKAKARVDQAACDVKKLEAELSVIEAHAADLKVSARERVQNEERRRRLEALGQIERVFAEREKSLQDLMIHLERAADAYKTLESCRIELHRLNGGVSERMEMLCNRKGIQRVLNAKIEVAGLNWIVTGGILGPRDTARIDILANMKKAHLDYISQERGDIQ